MTIYGSTLEFLCPEAWVDDAAIDALSHLLVPDNVYYVPVAVVASTLETLMSDCSNVASFTKKFSTIETMCAEGQFPELGLPRSFDRFVLCLNIEGTHWNSARLMRNWFSFMVCLLIPNDSNCSYECSRYTYTMA